MQKIIPFLWFDTQAEEAANFYASVFPDAKIHHISRFPEGSPAPAGSAMVVEMSMLGLEYRFLNAGPMYKFSEAVSFQIDCANQDEVDYYWDKLLADGGQTMACGWLKDKFGLTWQVTPVQMGALFSSGTPEQSARVMQAMMQMVKLDLPTLQRAFDGE